MKPARTVSIAMAGVVVVACWLLPKPSNEFAGATSLYANGDFEAAAEAFDELRKSTAGETRAAATWNATRAWTDHALAQDQWGADYLRVVALESLEHAEEACLAALRERLPGHAFGAALERVDVLRQAWVRRDQQVGGASAQALDSGGAAGGEPTDVVGGPASTAGNAARPEQESRWQERLTADQEHHLWAALNSILERQRLRDLARPLPLDAVGRTAW